MASLSIKRLSRSATVLLFTLIETWAIGPRASIAASTEQQQEIRTVGVISNLGDTITYTTSNRWTSGKSQGDISSWSVDARVVQIVAKSFVDDRHVVSLRVTPTALDDLADTTLAKQSRMIKEARSESLSCALLLSREYCSTYENPAVVADSDSGALRAKIRAVLQGHAGEADAWLIFRKGAGLESSGDRSAAQILSVRAPTHRIGITIAEIPDSGLGLFNKVMLQILGRLTVVDGKSLEPIADAPLSIIPTGSNFLQPSRVTPFWFLKKEYLVKSWSDYSSEQREQIRTTLDQLLTDAVTESLKETGLLKSPPPADASPQSSNDADGSP